jgi:S1-C subfamily serine protease
MRAKGATLAVGCIAALALVGCGGGGGEEPLSPQEVIEKASPATVELVGKSGDYTVGGSGIVYDSDRGLVLTNAHVTEGVSSLQAKIGDTVPLVSARVVGRAPCDDVAVVELVQKPAELSALTLGDSTQVESGDSVTVLGYPSNFQRYRQQTVSSTQGTVSNAHLVGNQISTALPAYPELIQHTAATNPGNSGGPLVDDSLNVVGINTLSAAARGQQGQYYSIAINRAKELLPELESGNDIANVGWALTPLDLVDPRTLAADIVAAYGISNGLALDLAKEAQPDYKGVYVNETVAGSPAREGLITRGDLITEIDNTPVRSVNAVCKILQSRSPGDTLEIDGVYIASSSKVSNFRDSWKTEVKIPKEQVAPPPATTTTP